MNTIQFLRLFMHVWIWKYGIMFAELHLNDEWT